MREQIKVLVVDDDTLTAKLFGHALEHLGFHVALACDGMNAIAECESLHPDLVLLSDMTRTAHLFSLYTLINRYDLMPRIIRFRNEDLAEVLYKCQAATAFDSCSKRASSDHLAS